jgi:hypothetical protein
MDSAGMARQGNGSMYTSQPAYPPQQPPQPLTADTPLAYYQPIAITPAIIRWLVMGVIGGIWSLYAAGWVFMPAKASELEALVKVVQAVQVAGEQQRQATDAQRGSIERLTLAVDNLSGIVAEIKARSPAVVIPRPARGAQRTP